MIVKQHRRNTDFEYRHFFAGKCHTPDGAWQLIHGQALHIQSDLEAAKVQLLQHRATLLDAQAAVENPDTPEPDRLRAQATIIETENAVRMLVLNQRGAEQELAALRQLEAEIAPQCRLDLSDPLAHQEALAQDEWREELKARAENMMLSNLTGIPYDHLETMRAHPDFNTLILPHILQVNSAIQGSLRTGDPAMLVNALAVPHLPASDPEPPCPTI